MYQDLVFVRQSANSFHKPDFSKLSFSYRIIVLICSKISRRVSNCQLDFSPFQSGLKKKKNLFLKKMQFEIFCLLLKSTKTIEKLQIRHMLHCFTAKLMTACISRDFKLQFFDKNPFSILWYSQFRQVSSFFQNFVWWLMTWFCRSSTL